jgi:hypothetical protein
MKYKSVIDISSIIWNPDDYDSNTSEYFKLKESIMSLIKSFKSEKPFIVLRTELLYELIHGFPFNKMPASFHEFGNIVYEFLGSIPASNRIIFAGQESEISSLPDIVKAYFNANTQLEANYLITYLHTDREIPNVYFTFQYLHGSEDNLTTFQNSNKSATLIIETIVSDDVRKLESFFRKYKRIFEHNPKHHAGHEQGDYVSPLSCFKGNNPSVAQKYLEEGILDGSRYYNFDLENSVYVVFLPTQDNIYHGHDETDRNKIPSSIRRRFNK